MLEFNKNHKCLEGSLKDKKSIHKVAKIALLGITIASLLMFSGCAKNVKCDIPEMHAHNYVSSTMLDKYVVSEREQIGDWIRTDDYILVDKQNADIINFANKNNLYKISDNQNKIDSIVASKSDYVEYRYSYVEIEEVVLMNADNSHSVTYLYNDRNSWTPDSSRSHLTGEVRNVHHMYYGCKIVVNEKGKYEIIKSDLVEDLSELSSDYDYVSSDFCVKVDANNKNVILNYEDGPENSNDSKLIQEIDSVVFSDSSVMTK